jgi:hypothetical protein
MNLNAARRDATMGTGSSDRLRVLSNEELGDVIVRCEDAITEGTANVDVFAEYVRAQQELSRRTWR